MGKKVEERDVGNERYTITQYDPKKAMRIYGQLTKNLDVFVDAIKNFKQDVPILKQEIDFGSIARRLGEMTENDYLYNLLRDVLSCALHHGDGRVIDKYDKLLGEHGLIHMLKVAAVCVEVNFESFFGVGVGEALELGSSSTQEKQTSTLSSGDQLSQEL